MRSSGTRILAAALLVFLVACGAGGCAPGPTVNGVYGRRHDVEGAELSVVDLSHGETLAAGTSALSFVFELSPAPKTAWAKRHVAVTGSGSQHTVEVTSQGYLIVSLKGGPIGERITVTLSGVSTASGEKVVKAAATRVEPPSVTLEVRDNGVWRPARRGECLPGQPLELRLVFSEEMDKPSVEAGLCSRDTWNDEPDFEELRWADGSTLLLRAPDKPGAIRLAIGGAKTVDGLVVPYDWLPTVFHSDPPRLCVYDPRQGSVQDCCAVPVNIYDASISPDGKTLHVESLEQETNDLAYSAVDVASGRLQPREPPVGGGDPASALWSLDGTPEKHLYGVVSSSPDGTRAAALVAAGDEISWEVERGPGHLYIIDTADNERRLVAADFARRCYHQHGASIDPSDPLWSPDGTRIAVVSDRSPTGVDVRVFNVSTGEAATVASLEEGDCWCRFTWSPDGRFWAVGNAIIAATAPYAQQQVEFGDSDRPCWSPDGRWFARGHEWGKVQVRDMEIGAERPLDAALICGWDDSGLFYFIRWEAGWERYLADWEGD